MPRPCWPLLPLSGAFGGLLRLIGVSIINYNNNIRGGAEVLPARLSPVAVGLPCVALWRCLSWLSAIGAALAAMAEQARRGDSLPIESMIVVAVFCSCIRRCLLLCFASL